MISIGIGHGLLHSRNYNEIFHFSQERMTDKVYKKICSKNRINYKIKMNYKY